MTDKQLERLKKKLNGTVVEELDAKSETELQTVIADAEMAIAQARRERDANEKYQEAKEICTVLSEGLKDVKTFQGAKISYAIHRIREIRGEIES